MSITIEDYLLYNLNKKELGIELYEKANENEISQFEKVHGRLPDDIKTFYRMKEK